MKKTIITLLTFITTITCIADDKQILRLDDEIITARSFNNSRSQTPGGIGILKLEQLQYQQAISISNLSNNIAGVSKTSDGAWGSDINIRGLARDSVIVLINGNRLETANDLNGRLGMIDPASIQKIEILKGPISALYGSGSMGGVVNIITRKGYFSNQPTTNSKLSLSYDTNPKGYNSYIFSSYNSKKYYISISQSGRNHDSYKDGNGNNITNSQFDDRETMLNLGYKFNEQHKIELSLQHFHGNDIGIPGTGTASLPQNSNVTYSEATRNLVNLTYTYTPNSDIWQQSRLNLYYHYLDRQVLVDGTMPNPALKKLQPRGQHTTIGLEWQNIITSDQHTLVIGYDAWQRKMLSERTKYLIPGKIQEIPVPETKNFSHGICLEDTYTPNQTISLNFGGRFDWIRVSNKDAYTYKSHFNPAAPNPQLFKASVEHDQSWNLHLGSTYNINDDWSTTAIIARGYRAASIEERYKYINLAGGRIFWGNPQLKPEESLFIELTLHHHKSQKCHGSISIFQNKLKNLIAQEDIAGGDKKLNNIAQARIWGIELETNIKLNPALTLYGNITYLNGRNTKLHQNLPDISPINGLIGIKYDPNNHLFADLNIKFANKQTNPGVGINKAPSWADANILIGYRFNTQHTKQQIYCGISNLFNKQYYDYLSKSRGFTLYEPGRTFKFGYIIEF